MGTYRLAKALRKHKVRVSVKKCKLTLETIKESVANKTPIIACIKTDNPWLHWVVVYGYDLMKETVYLANNGWDDPNGEISYQEFSTLVSGEHLVCERKE